MVTLEDAGYEVIKHPIKRVRVQFHAGLWYVEYQRIPKYFFDRWWWFDDSKHPEYKDAFVRAQELSTEGGIKEIRHKTLVFEVES
jgi:hypothetical protein